MTNFNAVFMGGGIKGIGLVGALKKVEEEDVNITRLAGSSAGAIVASLYAAGYSCEEIKDIFIQTNFEGLLDPGLFKPYQLWKYSGIYKGDKILKWISGLLSKKNVSTFSDLENLGMDLYIVASNITDKKIDVFDKRNYPNLNISTAVRMSIGIPVVFQPYKFDEKHYVDGGLLSNYPIWLFKSSDNPTIGFKLISDQNIESIETSKKKEGYLNSLVSTMLVAHDKRDESEWGANQTIHIPTGNIATTNFALDSDQKFNLFNRGYYAASQFLLDCPIEQVISEFNLSDETEGKERSSNFNLFEALQRAKKSKNYKHEKKLKITTVTKEVSILYPVPMAGWMQTEEGINVTDENIESIERTVLSGTPTDFQLLSCTGWHEIEGEKRESSVLGDSSSDRRRHNIEMKFGGRVLKPWGQIKFGYSLTWPGAMARKEEYAIFSCHNYEVPVERMKIRIGFRKYPKNINLYACSEDALQPIDIYETGIGKNFQDQELFFYEKSIEKPDTIYLVKWLI